MRAEGFPFPDLEPVAQPDDGDPVLQAKGGAQLFGQGDAPGGVKGQTVHAAQDRGFKRAAQGIAKGELVDQAPVLVEQGLAAAFDAIGFNGGKAEDAAERTLSQGAELHRHHNAPFLIQLLLKRREKHPRSSPSRWLEARQPLDNGLPWDEVGDNDTKPPEMGKTGLILGVGALFSQPFARQA